MTPYVKTITIISVLFLDFDSEKITICDVIVMLSGLSQLGLGDETCITNMLYDNKKD